MNSQGTEDENKAKLDSPALQIEVDHAEDNVSTLRDFEPLSEEIFDDRTVGFSTVEFCTVYKNNLYGNDIQTKRKSNSTIEKKSSERDVESAYISELPLEGCTRSTVDSGTDTGNPADDFAPVDERVEISPPQFCDFTERLQEGRVANSLPEQDSYSTPDKSQVIVHAPPGELGLTITGNPNSGQVQVNRVKLSSPLRSFIQEGDVLESVDGVQARAEDLVDPLQVVQVGAREVAAALAILPKLDPPMNTVLPVLCAVGEGGVICSLI